MNDPQYPQEAVQQYAEKKKKKIRSVHTDQKKGHWILRSVKKMRPKLMTRIRKDL